VQGIAAAVGDVPAILAQFRAGGGRAALVLITHPLDRAGAALDGIAAPVIRGAAHEPQVLTGLGCAGFTHPADTLLARRAAAAVECLTTAGIHDLATLPPEGLAEVGGWGRYASVAQAPHPAGTGAAVERPAEPVGDHAALCLLDGAGG
jgi:hypothetical protein